MCTQPIRNTPEEIERYDLCKEGEHQYEDGNDHCLICSAVDGYFYLEDQDSPLEFTKQAYEFYLGHTDTGDELEMSSQQWDRIKDSWYRLIVSTIQEMVNDPNYEGHKMSI